MRSLETFISALRASDVAVSPAEAVDAHLAAASVGWTDRTLLKDALCATLAKIAFEVERFDACFETYFRREEFRRRGATRTAASAAEKEDLATALLAGDGASLAASMEAAGVQAGVSEIRLSTQRSLIVRRILDLMGMRRLERRIAELEGSTDADERGLAGELAGRRSQLFEEAERFVARQERLHAGQSARRLREQILERQRLTTIAPEDLRAMEALTRRMARRLATRYARRRRRARRGDLDVRKTVAASMAHDGIPFQVIWKRKKIDKPKLMVLCDVSRSVAEAARFLLLFVYSLSEAVEHLEAYAFSDRLACVDDMLAEVSVEEAIALVMARSGLR
ncbi:MAG: VWA domain-containing protein, partial [Caulobacteraceae bacterium]